MTENIDEKTLEKYRRIEYDDYYDYGGENAITVNGLRIMEVSII